MHIANFSYECGIPFNVVNSRSYEIHDRVQWPKLELKENQEKAWKMYGCALMSDGWTDRQRRGLINFLTDSPQGNFIFGLINDSIE